MTYAAKIIADSISLAGHRVTTMEIVLPRIVLAEFNTHCMISRNSASSRAIPVEKMISKVLEHPYVPGEWGTNQKGMQAGEPLNAEEAEKARATWLTARNDAVRQTRELLALGVHKQLANRLLEPFMWHTIVCTATEWANFFNLRCHPDAHPAIRATAELMRKCREESTPKVLQDGEWHMPYIREEDYDDPALLAESFQIDSPYRSEALAALRKVSVGRCARVSYLTHDGTRDLSQDIALHDRLLVSGHCSPFEHVARPISLEEWEDLEYMDGYYDGIFSRTRKGTFCGKLHGWVPYRALIPNEEDILGEPRGAHAGLP